MKRLSVIALSLILIFAIVGCSEPIYELPWDHFCYYADGGGAIELEPEEKRFIIDLLNSGDWYDELAKCPADIEFAPQRQSVGYCTEEGIFNDFTREKSLKISEEDRITVNGYLGFR